MGSYISRLIEARIEKSLSLFGGVLIEGPKWCGKTTTSKKFAKSEIYLEDPNMWGQIDSMVRTKPSLILEGANPRLIDEWQEVPLIWDSVRMDIDRRDEEGLYILTGSTSIDWTKVRHSGTGRIDRIRMNTLSLFESGLSTGVVRLTDLFDGRDIEGVSAVTIEQMAEIVVKGGWPKGVGKPLSDARHIVKTYCESIVSTSKSDGNVLDRDIMSQLMRSLSRNTATSAADTVLIQDISRNDENPMHINTLRSYEAALRSCFVTDDLKAWSPKLRSKTVIRLSDTRHFCDPAIAAYFLEASPKNLMEDLNTYGYLFESLVVRDLRIYAAALGGEVRHYHDSYGLEVDAVVHLDDGRWGAIEIKLGAGYIEDAAKNLRKLAERVDTDVAGKPSFLAVVTCTPYAFRREDGVYVVPIACLRD